MFEKLRSKITGKKGIVNQDGSTWHLGAMQSGCYGLCGTTDGSYDNLFPDVSRIAEQIATILPYAVDAEGQKMDPQPQPVVALYNPNREMSGLQFFETLATLALVKPRVYIQVHTRNGQPIDKTGSNITGYTFLQGITPKYRPDGTATYTLKNGVLDSSRVIAISMNVNPYSVIDGYSPAMAAKKWASLDDYIADWNAGTFKNNAIPAGEFIITAKDADSFNAIVDEMERKHKGAGRNNNVSYVHRPTSAIDGKPLPAQIEWVPFAQSPKDLSLDSVFGQANKKTAMAFGVPEEIKGFVQNSNYASVATAERIFDKYTVLPKATKIWAQFTHELNRITGGLGWAITFDYEPAQFADENKVYAETTKIQLETLTSALDAGFDINSVVDALELPESFKALVLRQTAEDPEDTLVAAEAQPEVSQIETSTKVVEGSKQKTVASDAELEMLLEEYNTEEIEAAIEGKEFDIEQKSRSIAKDLLPIILGGAVLYALSREKELETQAMAQGYDVAKITTYEPSEEFQDTYLRYLEQVMFSYTTDTADAITRTFEMAHTNNFTPEETNMSLRELLPGEQWRVRRLQRTESHRSSQMASLDMARQVVKDLGIEGATKTWHLNSMTTDHCDLCESLDGVEIPLGDSFADLADLGHFSAGAPEVADAHPNCVLGDTNVLADQVKLATKFNYSGDVVKITTADGRVLSVTPNHILLTDKGWVRAKNIKKGFKTVAYSDRIKSAILSAYPAKNKMETPIADVFASLSKSLDVTTTSMPLTAIDFKGDAVENEKVDIILPKSLKGNEGDATTSKLSGNLDFIGSVKFASPLDGFSTLHQSLISILLASSGVPSTDGLGFSLSDCETSVPSSLGFALSSWYNSRIEKSATDCAAIDTELLGKSMLADSGLVKLDDVIDIEVNHVEDTPVYDLQTLSTLYLANGLVSSNCECYLTYNFPPNPENGEKTVKVKCPKCKRYICEASKSVKLTNVVCPRCGEHFDKEAE